MRFYFLLCFLLISGIIYSGCDSDSDSNPADSNEKTYDVEYKVTSGSIINEIKYLAQNGDTLTASNASSGWSYKWPGKGKTGNETYLKVTLTNTSAKAYLQILGNNTVLISDSLQGFSGGTASLARGTTLP